MAYNVSQLNLVRFNNTKLDKMEELIKTLEEIKEHQMQTVQLARTTTVYKLADKAINQALLIAPVVGRSEQLPQNLCTLIQNTCGKGSGCKYPHCHL